MHAGEYVVLDPATFLRESLAACPEGSVLSLDDQLVGQVSRELADLALSRQPLHEPRYRVDPLTRPRIVSALCKTTQIFIYIALSEPTETSLWFEAPHFGEHDEYRAHLYEHFPEELADRLRRSRIIVADF